MQPLSEAVPFLDLSHEFEELEAAWLAAIRETGRTGQFIMGPNVTAFEQESADYIGVRHVVSVANGTDALTLSLRALGLGPGDEVITTPFTFFATSEAINHVGARPVFADIEADSFNLDPYSVRQRITERTRLILVVHLFGRPADMPALTTIAREHDLQIVEDCAQAFGATVGPQRVGSIGTLGCFSFYPTKVLGCYGDGGMISTDSAELAEHLRRLRNHGAVRSFEHVEVGHNSRLDEVQAALLRLKLPRVAHAIERRRQVAAWYRDNLGDCVESPAHGDGHVFNLYTVKTSNRDRVREYLTGQRIATSVVYPVPLHLQEVHASLSYRPGDLPVAERLCGEVLSLPIYPDMSEAQVVRVCTAVREAL